VGIIKFADDSVVVLGKPFMATWTRDPFRHPALWHQGRRDGAGLGDNPIEIFTETDKQLFNLSPKNIPDVKSSHVMEVQAFVDAILNGKPSPVPGENGLILNAIFDAMYKSSETAGKRPWT